MGFFYIVRAYGGKAVIRALISYPRQMSARAVLATIGERITLNNEEQLFRFYLTESVRIFAKSQGASYIKRSYESLIDGTPETRAPQKSGDEIAAEVIKDIGLEVKTNEPI